MKKKITVPTVEQLNLIALKELPITLHRGKLDINEHKRESWLAGAIFMRNQIGLAAFEAFLNKET